MVEPPPPVARADASNSAPASGSRSVHIPLAGAGTPVVDLERVALAAPVASWVMPASEAPETSSGPAPDPALDPALKLVLDEFALTDGDVSVHDQGLDFEGGLKEFSLTAQQLRFPDLRAQDLHLSGLTAASSPLVITGSLEAGIGAVELLVDSLPLPRFSALVKDAAGYELHDGTLSLDTKVAIQGERYETDTDIVLHDLDISADDPGIFSDMFGMPLDLALALLRDPSGDIELDVPVVIDGGEVEAGIGTIVGAALREALVGAVTSPFKLLGAILELVDGEKAELQMQPFLCIPGEVTLVDGVGSRVGPVLELLEARPALALRLRGSSGPEDRDGLALALLTARAVAGEELPDLEDAGWFAPGRVNEALVARSSADGSGAAGAAGALDAEDEALLARYVAAVEPDAAAYEDLARRRAEAVRDRLIAEYGLDPLSIVTADPSNETAPAVHTDFTIRGR